VEIDQQMVGVGVREMKKYANFHGYTDVEPCEVVRVVSDRTLEIRRMEADLDPDWSPRYIPGGFSAFCINNSEQEWIIFRNEDNSVFRVRLHKDQKWYDKHGSCYVLSDMPRKFHDYNF